MTCITQHKEPPKHQCPRPLLSLGVKFCSLEIKSKLFCGSDFPLWIFLPEGSWGNKGYGLCYPEMCGTDPACLETLLFLFSCRGKRLMSVWCLSNFSTQDQLPWHFFLGWQAQNLPNSFWLHREVTELVVLVLLRVHQGLIPNFPALHSLSPVVPIDGAQERDHGFTNIDHTARDASGHLTSSKHRCMP